MIKFHHNISAIKDKYNFTNKRMYQNSKNPKPQIMMKAKDYRKEENYDYFRIYFK